MRDCAILTIEGFGVDLDIVNGVPEYISDYLNSEDQRAALAVFMCKGTIPGALDTGVSWSEEYNPMRNAMLISNEAQMQVQELASSSKPTTNYGVTMLGTNDSLSCLIMRGSL